MAEIRHWNVALCADRMEGFLQSGQFLRVAVRSSSSAESLHETSLPIWAGRSSGGSEWDAYNPGTLFTA